MTFEFLLDWCVYIGIFTYNLAEKYWNDTVINYAVVSVIFSAVMCSRENFYRNTHELFVYGT